MSQIRGRDTKPELILRRALWAAGLRYRLHYGITGRPDLVFPRPRVAVFCDGCFWHGCPAHSTKPKTNSSFWAAKLARNRARDKTVTTILKREGWTVIRFWEHDIKANPEKVAAKIAKATRSPVRHKS